MSYPEQVPLPDVPDVSELAHEFRLMPEPLPARRFGDFRLAGSTILRGGGISVTPLESSLPAQDIQ